MHLQGEVEKLKTDFDLLKKQLLGPKSEKMPPPVPRGTASSPEEKRAEARRKRREAAVAKEALVTESVQANVPEPQRTCPHCRRDNLKTVGDGKASTIFDYVPGYFRRRVTARETLACPCGQYIVTAPAPDRVGDKTRYSASFIAHLVTAKCGDSIPLYRLETQYRRIGIPIARSTMTDLFHRAAFELAPLSRRLVERVASAEIVLADETGIRMQGTTKRAFMWTFIAGNLIAFRFSVDRSGETPAKVLGGTQGTLVVDAYTGYNRVTGVGKRTRAGCLAHARRKLFEAKDAAHEVHEALEIIRDVYIVEHEAKERRLVGTPEHLTLRESRTRPLMARLFRWLRHHRGRHPPKGLMGRAVRYALNNRRELTRFLYDARIPPDNNRSESALRVVALGRKNFLFVGHEDAGNNIAGLYSLIATCTACGVNPLDYIRDVLMRVAVHPHVRIDELLPDAWRPAP